MEEALLIHRGPRRGANGGENYAMTEDDRQRTQRRVNQLIQQNLNATRPSPPDPPYSVEEMNQDNIDIDYRCQLSLDFPCKAEDIPVKLPKIPGEEPRDVFCGKEIIRMQQVASDWVGSIQHPQTRERIFLTEDIVGTLFTRLLERPSSTARMNDYINSEQAVALRAEVLQHMQSYQSRDERRTAHERVMAL